MAEILSYKDIDLFQYRIINYSYQLAPKYIHIMTLATILMSFCCSSICVNVLNVSLFKPDIEYT